MRTVVQLLLLGRSAPAASITQAHKHLAWITPLSTCSDAVGVAGLPILQVSRLRRRRGTQCARGAPTRWACVHSHTSHFGFSSFFSATTFFFPRGQCAHSYTCEPIGRWILDHHRQSLIWHQ